VLFSPKNTKVTNISLFHAEKYVKAAFGLGVGGCAALHGL